MYSLPEIFIRRLESQDYIDSAALTAALGEPSPVSVRINRAKTGTVPENTGQVPWCSEGWYLSTRPSFTADPLFHAGAYYPQEASSMFTGYLCSLLCAGRKELRVLDLCGAPGGKSTHLSSVIGNDSLLVANEVIKSRVTVLDENLTRWGIPNYLVTNSDPRDFARLKNYFDIVVADAPCSGEGMFRDEVARREWSEANARICSDRQRRIVSDVWPSLAPGGYLVYSTCTFNPAENEENIEWISENLGAESVSFNLTPFPGITEICYKGIKGYGFYPGKISGEGFFIAVLRKNEEAVDSTGSNRNRRRNSPVPLAKNAAGLINGDAGRIILQGDNLILSPCDESDLTLIEKSVKIVSRGTVIAKVAGKELIPAHSLAMSVARKEGVFPEAVLDISQAVSYLRRDNTSLPSMPAGWNLVTYRNVALGFVKNIGSRVNNYYPVDLRIRMEVTREHLSGIIGWK